MAFSCGAKLAKSVLISFNFVFWVSGCALIGLGVYNLLADHKTTLFVLFRNEESYADLQFLSYGFIAIGSLVFIVGFFGCFGAIREHKSMIIAYFIFLFIILVCELTVGVLAVFFQNKSEETMEESLKFALKNHYGVDAQTTKALDLAQTKFNCCGIASPSEYTDSAWSKNEGSGKTVSPSCCTRIHSENSEENFSYVDERLCQREEALNKEFRHQQVCLANLKEFLQHESTLFIGMACYIAALQVFGMVFSMCLCRDLP